MDLFLGLLSLLDACYAVVITPLVLATLTTSKMVISYGRCAPKFFVFTIFTISSPNPPSSSPSVHSSCSLWWPMTALLPLATHWAITWWCLQTSVWACWPGPTSVGYQGPPVYRVCIYPLLLWWRSNQLLLPAKACLPQHDTKWDCHPLSCQMHVPGQWHGHPGLLHAHHQNSQILRAKSTGGKAKTFSTCTSCLTAFVLFLGTLAFTCQRSNSDKIPRGEQDCVFYTVVIPMLNPLTYSLRNKDIKGAIREVVCKIQFPTDVVSIGSFILTHILPREISISSINAIRSLPYCLNLFIYFHWNSQVPRLFKF